MGLAERDLTALVTKSQPARLRQVERFLEEGQAYISSQYEVAVDSGLGCVEGDVGGLFRQNMQVVTLLRRDRRCRRRRPHRGSGERRMQFINPGRYFNLLLKIYELGAFICKNVEKRQDFFRTLYIYNLKITNNKI